jgi:hypothetical protein
MGENRIVVPDPIHDPKPNYCKMKYKYHSKPDTEPQINSRCGDRL